MHMLNQLMRWKWVILWCALIFYSSHRPVPPTLSEKETFVGIDLIYHFIAYGILGFLFFKAHANLKTAFLFVFFYGLSDEIHQSVMPFREFELSDILMDGIGGGVGAWVCQKYISGR